MEYAGKQVRVLKAIIVKIFFIMQKNEQVTCHQDLKIFRGLAIDTVKNFYNTNEIFQQVNNLSLRHDSFLGEQTKENK
jgi:hypothetical protein